MIFNMVGGGGGSGATLVVSSPANVSVTVSKDDKSYTKNSGSLGSATFKGLSTGTWTVTISGNGQTATKTIEITADYAITLAFFSATINITYPANSNCVVANSGGQTVASDTNTGTSAKTWTATVNAKGTYTITATATDSSGKTKSTTVSITTDGQSVSMTLSYELVLFDGGDNTAVTGGWKAVGHGSPQLVLGNDIGIDGSLPGASGYKSWMFATNNLVDVRGHTKLHALVKTISGITTAQLCVTNEIKTNDGKYLGANDPVASADASVGECVLDISSLNGSYHLGLWCKSNIVSYNEYHIALLASKIWLE